MPITLEKQAEVPENLETLVDTNFFYDHFFGKRNLDSPAIRKSLADPSAYLPDVTFTELFSQNGS